MAHALGARMGRLTHFEPRPIHPPIPSGFQLLPEGLIQNYRMKLLHLDDLQDTGFGIIIKTRSRRKRREAGQVLLGDQFIQVLGESLLLGIEHVDGFSDRGQIHDLVGRLLRLEHGPHIIRRCIEGIFAHLGYIGRGWFILRILLFSAAHNQR